MTEPANKNPYPWWKVKIWYGMTLVNWLSLVARYRLDLTIDRLHRTIIVTIVATVNLAMAAVQWLFFGRQVARAPVPPPIFIIGHWRTGTTFLHELMAVDDRFLTPNAMQCMCPDHFLFSAPFMNRLEFMLPDNRPMDNFEVHWNAPQEDEFALLAMGARSPYELFAFPRAYTKALKALDIDSLSSREQARWRRCFVRFLKTIVVARQRAGMGPDSAAMPDFMLLKSPTHTARLRVLAEMFPQARFIHLTRDRQKLFASSVSLWRAMTSTQALHKPPARAADGRDLNRAMALEAFDALYAHFERDRNLIDAERILDVQFEDLTRAPRKTMEEIYRFLGIDIDAETSERLDRRIGEFTTYEAARHQLASEDEALVEQHWSHYPMAYQRAETS